MMHPSPQPLRFWLVLGVGMTLVSGLLHGHMTQRWGQDSLLLAAAAHLQQFPIEVPGWRLQDTMELPPEALEMLQCPAYLQRLYVHEATGQAVNLAVLVGPAGPMSVHTPEICYPSRDYAILQARERVNVPVGDGQTDQFWALTLGSPGVHGGRVRVYYGWHAGAGWQAPEQPRFSLAGRPFLYKLQLAATLPREDTAARDPCAEFLDSFLPQFHQHLSLRHLHTTTGTEHREYGTATTDEQT